MKRPGERITLTYLGPRQPLEVGVIIETTTGRRYEVIELGAVGQLRNGRDYQKLVCRVMRPGERVADDATIFYWRWSPRRRAKP